MPLAGRAFLALWNDIAAAREDEYDEWHTREHVPERVAVRGFHGARRYVARARREHRYFTLYDIASLDALDGADYRDLVDRPTPWSASMRADFANFLRVTCDVESSEGFGLGAAIATLCFDAPVASEALRAALAQALAAPRVNAVHVGRVARRGPSSPLPSSASDATVRTFDRVALVEAVDRRAAFAALDALKTALGLHGLPHDFGADVYDLAFAFPSHDGGERARHRRHGGSGAG
jgi:hypothetical protein